MLIYSKQQKGSRGFSYSPLLTQSYLPGLIYETPLYEYELLDKAFKGEVKLKLENMQVSNFVNDLTHINSAMVTHGRDKSLLQLLGIIWNKKRD